MRKLAMLAAIGLALACARADASVFTVTYTGKVTFIGDDTDYFDLFSSPNPSGAISLQFTIDSDASGSDLRDYGNFVQLDGSGQAGNPFVRSSFTLNGRTVTWSNSPGDGYDSSYGFAEQSHSPGYDEVFHSSYDYGQSADSYDTAAATVTSALNNIVNGTDLTAPLEYGVQAGDTASGSFGSVRYNEATGLYSRYVGLNFDISHVSIAAAVPEPGTWAMMIAGMGLMGGTMRRRSPSRAPYRVEELN